MRITALIFGILAGLSGLSVAALGHAMSSMGGSGGGFLLYILPLASLVGGGLAISKPGTAATLMGISGVGWLLIGMAAGYGINFITITAVTLSLLGALFAALGSNIDSEPAVSQPVASSLHGASAGLAAPSNSFNSEK